MKAGDRVRIEQSGGGGWGEPTMRNPDDVLRDVDEGVVSIDSARRDYGVLLARNPTGALYISGIERA